MVREDVLLPQSCVIGLDDAAPFFAGCFAAEGCEEVFVGGLSDDVDENLHWEGHFIVLCGAIGNVEEMARFEPGKQGT